MNRLVTLDANDRIVAEGRIPLSEDEVEAGYWFFNMAPSHEDFYTPLNGRVIP